jgi:acyl carrier protein
LLLTSFEQIKNILTDTLELGASFNDADEETLLLGSVPELDSMGVIAVITALEEQFDIFVEDDDISGETFASLGSLVQFIDDKINTE